jgi:hypothetical protein
MRGLKEFAAAFALFFASHLILTRPAIRERLIGRVGRVAYGDLASSVWQAHRRAGTRAPNLAMPFVCLLLAFGIAVPKPLSIAGRNNDRRASSFVRVR